MKTNIRLSLLSIVRVEQMLKKPFVELDYTNEGDLLPLLYCMVSSANSERFSFKQFLSLMESKEYSKSVFEAFNLEGEIIAQFNDKQNEEQSEGKSGFIKDAVYLLINSGINSDYLLNKMEVCDLHDLMKAYSEMKREKMESDRLWTYISMLPHLDGKKKFTQQDIYPFPWEAENMKKQAETDLSENAEYLEKFLSGEIEFNLNN